MKRRQAVILAGGLGTRLRTSTGDLPKPMVPVRGQPFLRRQLELLRDRGMTQALLLTGHRAEVIHDHFERQPIEGIELAYSREPAPLGTGGALREAAAQLEPRFVLVNGDTYLDARYAELLEQADRDGATAMMVVYQDAEGSLDQPGNVDLDADGLVVAYQKSASGRGLPYLDAGCHGLEPQGVRSPGPTHGGVLDRARRVPGADRAARSCGPRSARCGSTTSARPSDWPSSNARSPVDRSSSASPHDAQAMLTARSSIHQAPYATSHRCGDGARRASPRRLGTGIAGLDELLDGGLPRSSTTVVEGGTGAGKTLLTLQFLMEGARRGERGVLFTLEETPGQLRAVARSMGWDLGVLEASGQLIIKYASPVELSTDRFLSQARSELRELGASRAVFDSLTTLARGIPSPRRFKEMVYALTKHLRAERVTTLMTAESVQLLGATQLSGDGVSFLADNVIQLRYIELDGRLERAVSVLKARGIRHNSELRSMVIQQGGMQVVAGRFMDLRGVLTGLPTRERQP